MYSKLRLPNMGSYQVPQFSDPNQLATWLRQMPLHRPMEAGHALYNTVLAVNKIGASDPTLHYRFLRTLEEHLNKQIEVLRQKCRHPYMPLPVAKYSISFLLQNLLEEIMAGYFSVIDKIDHSQLLKTSRQRNMLTHSVYCAIHYCAECALESFSRYTEVPTTVWNIANKSYRMAERYQFTDQVLAEFNERTVDNAYVRLLMLSLSNPNHLMQGEADRVYQLLEKWTDLVEVEAIGSRSPSGKLFIELVSAQSPFYVRKDQRWKDILPKEGRLINVKALIRKIDKLIASAIKRSQDGNLSPMERFRMIEQRDLLLRLVRAWGERPERQHERVNIEDQVIMATGIQTAYHYVSNDVGAVVKQEENTAKQPELEMVDMGHGDEYEFVFDAGAEDAVMLSASSLSDWLQLNESVGGFHLVNESGHCDLSTQSEESEGGAAITIAERSLLNVRVGDVAAYRKASCDGGNWYVGAIRWMRSSPNQKIDVGIMKIAEESSPVIMRAVSGTGLDTGDTHGLLLIGQGEGSMHELLTPSLIYDVGTHLHITTNAGSYEVCLTKMLDTTGSYCRFQYELCV